MIRRTFLRRLALGPRPVSPPAPPAADPVDDITAEIRAQGFTIVRVQRTLLGRVRIIGQRRAIRREVVIDPTTGEIRRDLLIPRQGSGASQGAGARPQLGTSRDIGKIEEDAPRRRTPSRTRATATAPTGAGDGARRTSRPGSPARTRPARARMARMHRKGGGSAARAG